MSETLLSHIRLRSMRRTSATKIASLWRKRQLMQVETKRKPFAKTLWTQASSATTCRIPSTFSFCSWQRKTRSRHAGRWNTKLFPLPFKRDSISRTEIAKHRDKNSRNTQTITTTFLKWMSQSWQRSRPWNDIQQANILLRLHHVVTVAVRSCGETWCLAAWTDGHCAKLKHQIHNSEVAISNNMPTYIGCAITCCYA